MRCSVPAFLTALFAAACGGSSGGEGGNTPAPTIEQLVLYETTHRGIFKDINSIVYVYTAEMGDDTQDRSGRLIFRFDLATVPAGVVVTGAVLTLYQTSTVGDAYLFGDMIADHVDWPLGVSLTPDHWFDYVLDGSFGSCLAGPMAIGIPRRYTLQVGGQVQADLDAARTSTALRFRFADVVTDNDGANDRFVFGGSYGNPPVHYQAEIVVDYYMP